MEGELIDIAFMSYCLILSTAILIKSFLFVKKYRQLNVLRKQCDLLRSSRVSKDHKRLILKKGFETPIPFAA